MEFSVLNKRTIQCIMTEDEIADYGMDKQTLFQNNHRVQEFFRQIMQQAEKETGFCKEQGNVAVHASFLDDESLAITFFTGCKDRLLHETGVLHSISSVILKSKSLENMIGFCRQTLMVPQADLYKYQKTYYLLADISQYKPAQTAMLFILADEYLDAVCYTPGIVAFLREHGKQVIADRAIEVLGIL